MAYPGQNFVLFDAMNGENGLGPAAGQHQHQLAMEGRDAGPSYFLNTPMMGSSMYSVNPLLVEAPVSATLAAAATGGAVGAEGRRRSPTHGRSGSSAADHAQRRATHNAIERARRESLNGQFQDLASAVPSLIQVRRPSKATIVEKSLDYIRTFKSHLGRRDQYIKKLQLRNLALRDEVNRLRSQMGMEPLAEACEPASESDEAEEVSDSSTSREEPAEAAMAVSAPAVAVSAAAMAVSAPAPASPPQLTLLQKRRQQSLDLGSVEAAQGAGRAELRVRTSASPASVGSTAASSQSSPLMRGSPLSAPLLSQMPQLPSNSCEQQQLALALAATHQSQLQSIAQFAMPMNLSPLPASSMAGFMPAPPIDMGKLSDVFASAASMPPASAVMSLATDIAEMGTQYGGIAQ
ncbi:hypothetical protein IWW52_004598 [Coemansia sp. RSA 2704]|nr:hypothetical protein IWW52_004598 [Coemansia sp. RSA 2704]